MVCHPTEISKISNDMTISQVYFQHKPEPHPLRALVETMLSGIETLEAAHATYGVPYPSLDDPHRIPTPLDDDVHVIAATNLIVAASAQILATARKPIETLQNHALSMYMTTSLGFVIEANIADILKDAGQGRIGRVLRHLAAHHIFKEVSPNVFANNQISSLLAKAKSLEEIKAE
ncbi:hypothetical protein H0H81_004294 [Sphagnurus paluster]|uniref:Uncharacterized protein n=1 Tax=Sphagnurus paluster TaxID=117069 RepID=A0A9P7GVV1_9AGAR|nr:hypothetical protein H0H81_004294 [Sphagnurus paluster]